MIKKRLEVSGESVSARAMQREYEQYLIRKHDEDLKWISKSIDELPVPRCWFHQWGIWIQDFPTGKQMRQCKRCKKMETQLL